MEWVLSPGQTTTGAGRNAGLRAYRGPRFSRFWRCFFFFFFRFLSWDSSALICWFSTYLLGTSGALMFFLPSGCGGVWIPDLLITRWTFYHQATLPLSSIISSTIGYVQRHSYPCQVFSHFSKSKLSEFNNAALMGGDELVMRIRHNYFILSRFNGHEWRLSTVF